MPHALSLHVRRPVRLRRGPELLRERGATGTAAAVWALVLICAGAHPLAQSEAGYRANIGRTALSATTGAEIGKIVDAALANGIWVYKVNRGGRISAVPVEAVRATEAWPTDARPTDTRVLPVRPPALLAHPATVAPLLLGTAAEFRRRLARTGGLLQELLLTPKGISAEWSSANCAAFEPEVIGLLQSITQTQKASAAVAGARICGGQSRSFAISGATLDAYRNGKIGDPGVRAALK